MLYGLVWPTESSIRKWEMFFRHMHKRSTSVLLDQLESESLESMDDTDSFFSEINIIYQCIGLYSQKG